MFYDSPDQEELLNSALKISLSLLLKLEYSLP